MADLTAQQAWARLRNYNFAYYSIYSAMYSGDHLELSRSGPADSFWRRRSGKCKLHVPIAADIAATSADLLFSKPPRITVFHEGSEENEEAQQARMDAILRENGFYNKLNEAAETCAAMGDVYLKLRWSQDADIPVIDVVQPDAAWPEYVFGKLTCCHFFTELSYDPESKRVIRVYERYERGKIHMEMYSGDGETLGAKLPDQNLQNIGYAPEIKAPVDELLCVHIANIRPNRIRRASMHGRSDLDNLRDLCDALDETYSSWLRDVRLSKARTIIPSDYLRKKPSSMMSGLENHMSWEFDEDVETYVAMNINTDEGKDPGIQLSQFAIRAQEHADTCTQIVLEILSRAGYSPQTFGMNIDGSAQSGTALSIREKKSVSTRNKKQTYWLSPLENILTAMLKLDAALYPSAGSDGKDVARVSFSDSMATDVSTVAQAVQMLVNAQSASIDTRLRMLHPDWGDKQIEEEKERLSAENAAPATEDIDRILGVEDQESAEE